MTRRISAHCRAKIQQWEGLRLAAYRDGAGVWTIGYGSTSNVREGMVITQAEADKRLRDDLAEAEYAVSRLVKVELTDNQFGALVSFVFNVGVAAFGSSTLLKLLNQGDYASVPGQLARWNKITVGGRKVADKGLSNRRAAEAGLWALGEFVQSASSAPASPAKPLAKSKTMQGATLTGTGAVGSTLLDTANQVQVVADYSDTLRLVFVGLMVAGITLTVYGRLRLRKEEGL